MLYILLISAVFATLTVQAFADSAVSETQSQSRITYLQEPVIKYGIDVSFWQEDIDWEKVARTSIEFVMIRAGRGAIDDDITITEEVSPNKGGNMSSSSATENACSEDTRFREYITGAQESGIDVGVYFYSYAKTVQDIRKEAQFLVNLLRDFQITYPVALDMEEEVGHYIDNPSDMAEAFLEIISKDDAGYLPMMYSSKSWLEDYLSRDVQTKYLMWVAHTEVPATNYRGNYYMWQYSHTGRVSGIVGNVDLNIAYIDFADK